MQYYLLAFNVHRLWQLHWVMSLSLVKTLANKFRTSARQIRQQYQMTRVTPHGTQKVLEVVVARGEKKKPLVARFGGIELRWQKGTILDEQPREVYGVRSEVVQRLLAKKCELCGAEGSCQVHHVRKLADRNQPGRSEKPLWVKRMATRHRKTLVVCQSCQEAIHRERPSRHSFRSKATRAAVRSKDSCPVGGGRLEKEFSNELPRWPPTLPHVRFGGGRDRNQSVLPTPIQTEG